jgi:two-component system, LuxR family, response regulator FixJ
MTSGRTIHVVDDDEAMRDSLVALLEDAGYDSRSYASAEELLARGTLEPGCVVSDIRMPGMDGLTLLKKLRAEGDGLPLILITGHGDILLAVAAMKAGATDFLEKPFEAEALLDAIEAGLRHQANTAPAPEDLEAARRCLETLTSREREVLERLVAGESNKEVAQKLGISHRTIEFHRAHILEKTGAKGLPDLVRLWLSAA